MKKQLLTLAFATLALFGFSQDKIYKRDGEIIKCKVTDILDEKVFYKAIEGDDITKEIKKSEIDLIKYSDGKTEDYSSVKKEEKGSSSSASSGGGEKWDRNSDEFVNYANSLAKQVGEALLRDCAGRYDNANTSVYFDACFKDPYSGEIAIPIRISYQKGAEGNDRFIKGMIKISKDGAKTWVYQDSQHIMFTGCAKKFVFK